VDAWIESDVGLDAIQGMQKVRREGGALKKRVLKEEGVGMERVLWGKFCN
jgi:hypothetical protein